MREWESNKVRACVLLYVWMDILWCLIIVPIVSDFVWSLHISFPFCLQQDSIFKLIETFNKCVISSFYFFFHSFFFRVVFHRFASRFVFFSWLLLVIQVQRAPIRETLIYVDFLTNELVRKYEMCSKGVLCLRFLDF